MERRESCMLLRCFMLLMVLGMVSLAHPVSVQAAPRLNRKTVTLLKGKNVTLRVKGTRKKAAWKSSKKKVAALEAKRKNSVKVKALRHGTATVSAKVGRKRLKCKVRVSDPAISRESLVLEKGESAKLEVKKSFGKIVWKSTYAKAVKCSVDGRTATIKAEARGISTVVAKVDGRTLRCRVIVKESTGETPPKDPVLPEPDIPETQEPETEEPDPSHPVKPINPTNTAPQYPANIGSVCIPMKVLGGDNICNDPDCGHREFLPVFFTAFLVDYGVENGTFISYDGNGVKEGIKTVEDAREWISFLTGEERTLLIDTINNRPFTEAEKLVLIEWINYPETMSEEEWISWSYDLAERAGNHSDTHASPRPGWHTEGGIYWRGEPYNVWPGEATWKDYYYGLPYPDWYLQEQK